jgi:hypothetical protein
MQVVWRASSGDEQDILRFLWRHPSEAAARREENEKDKAGTPQLFSSKS